MIFDPDRDNYIMEFSNPDGHALQLEGIGAGSVAGFLSDCLEKMEHGEKITISLIPKR